MSYFSHHPEQWDQIEQDAVLTKLGWADDDDSPFIRVLLSEIAATFPDQWRAIVDQVDVTASEQDFWGGLTDAAMNYRKGELEAGRPDPIERRT